MDKRAILILGFAAVAIIYIAKPWKPRTRQALPVDVLAVLASSDTWDLYRAGQGEPVSIAGVKFSAPGPARSIGGDQKASLLIAIQAGIEDRAQEVPYLVAAYGPEFVLHATYDGVAVTLMFSFGAMERINYTIGQTAQRGFVNTSSYPKGALQQAAQTPFEQREPKR